MTWDDWIKKNEDALKDGFELQFSQQVLRYVRGIKPEDVIPQAAWKDSKGVNRRFDFRIVVPARGLTSQLNWTALQKIVIRKDGVAF